MAAAQAIAYLGAVTVVGAAILSALVLRPHAREPWHGAASLRAATIGLASAALLGLGDLARLWAQTYATFGVDEPLRGQHFGIILTQTPWGRGWMVQLAVALLAGATFAIARSRPRLPRGVVGLLAPVVALSLPLTGHAIAQAEHPVRAVVIQTLHVLAGAGWLGTLLVLWLVCFGPRPRLTDQMDAMVASLVRVFSPLALAGGAVAVTAGGITALMYFDSIPQVWTTSYGQVLLLKVTLVATTAAFGAYNWRRVKPHLGAAGWSGVLRRSAGAELGFAFLLLVTTAVLVGMPFPGE